MKEKKNIDRIFQERFKNFEAPAPSGAWENIESRLNQEDLPVIIPLFWKIAGVAAVLLFIVSAVLWNTTDSFSQETFVLEEPAEGIDVDSDPNDPALPNTGVVAADELENSTATPVDNSDRDPQEASLKTNQIKKGKNYGITTATKSTNANEATKRSANGYANTTPASIEDIRNNDPTSSSFSNLSQTQEGMASNQGAQPSNNARNPINTDTAIADVSDNNEQSENINSTEQSLEDIAAASKEPNSKLPEEDLFKKNWAASTMVAPVYANTMGGSSINNEVSDNSKNADVNLSYGVAVSYEFAPRWSVRTGVNQVSMNYNTQDVSYGLNAQTLAVNNTTAAVMYNADAVNNQTPTAFNDSFAQELVSAATFSSFKGELSQQLGYLEVPLEVKYRLVDSKLGVSLLGGMSALFLTDNEVAVTNDGRKLSLGEDRNFQEFNQSANFGLGIDYRFTNKLGITVEPTFKYQLNALRDDSANFRPYTVGVYTGLMYRF